MSLGERLGSLFHKYDKKRRLIALNNLNMVWGGIKPQSELEEIARKCFINLGLSLVEICRFPLLNEKNIDDYIEVEGWEHFEEAQNNKRGTLVVTAHFGNWELLATAIALRGHNSSIIVRPIDNPHIDRLLTGFRTRFGNDIIPKKKALKKIVKCLKEGGLAAMLMDQSTAPQEAVLAKFFGFPCYTLIVPVILAQKTGCAIIPIFMVRLGNNKHKIVINPEVTLDQTGDREKDLLTNTQKLNDIIEHYVTKYPDHWLWIHRRWKF